MRISWAIIYQQIRQLFWHLLICFGLVLLIPLEEAIINLRDGEGFFSVFAWRLSIVFSPLLTGLIGCANVQADLNDKRYMFWRSKPASTKLFIALKYFIGLIAALMFVMSAPVFAFISCRLNSLEFQVYLPGSNNTGVLSSVLIGIMTYSLCFGGNVLIRKSARAWLLGMVMACFVLVVPFMLPLGYKDFVSDVIVSMSAFYILLIVIVSAIAFVFSLFAAEYDWYLKTNLKRILWAGFGLAFAVTMFFSSQVANIRILQAKQVKAGWNRPFCNINEQILFLGPEHLDIVKDDISFEKKAAYPSPIVLHGKRPAEAEADKKYWARRYPRVVKNFQIIEGELYCFNMEASGWKTDKKVIIEKLVLRSFKYVEDHWEVACELEMSDCLKIKNEDSVPVGNMAMRYIDNKIIAYINGNMAVIDATEPTQLKLIDKKSGFFKRMSLPLDAEQKITIPLIPAEGIDIIEKIRLSIDFYYEIFIGRPGVRMYSIVDIDGERISFFHVSETGVKRYDVTGWDDRKIYCKLSVERSFTILERIPNSWRYRVFAKDGKLYACSEHILMVFDIHSGERIRKLGHFVRTDFYIIDIAVLENGNILMCALYNNYKFLGNDVKKLYLYLLEGP